MESDYHSSVYAWFERCGIISNVRTHLRQNLVNALKSKDMTLDKINTGPKSAKQYVYDLLIGEYLWNHNYTYTLSVFASEAPLLVNFWRHMTQTSGSLDSTDKQKLQDDYVFHILETLGIGPDETGGQSIIAAYANNDVPLLLSILNYIRDSKKVNTKVQKIPYDNVKCMKSCETQTEFRKRDISEEQKKLVEAKKRLLKQKEFFDGQLMEKENELKDRAKIIEQQMTMLDEKLSQAQSLMEAATAKEKKLHQNRKEDELRIHRQKLELSEKEIALAREAERLKEERSNYGKFETNLKMLQDELAKVKQELPNSEKNVHPSLKEIYTQTEEYTPENTSLPIDQEKLELQNLVREQQSRIEELTLRAIRLSRQLEEAQLTKNNTATDFPKTSKPAPHLSRTIFSESSSTDEIIQDARQRLKRLKEETLNAGQCYFNSIIASPI